MTERIAYDDAVDLLDADHKAVKQMFIAYGTLCDDSAPGAAKHKLAQRICRALAIHAQIEEEIFYPKVREAIGHDALMDEALHDHAQAKEAIARIESMKASDKAYDPAVRKLGELIDRHVLEEREGIFLKARQAPLDLRAMTLTLLDRRKQLIEQSPTASAKAAA